jgi:hypothetical protein
MWPFKKKAEPVKQNVEACHHWFYSDWELMSRCTTCDASAPRDFVEEDAAQCCPKCGAMEFTIEPLRSYEYIAGSFLFKFKKFTEWLSCAKDDYPVGKFTLSYIDAIIKERKGS